MVLLAVPPSGYLPRSVIRIGHPARLLPKVIQPILVVFDAQFGQGEILSNAKREIDELLGKPKIDGKGR